MMKEEEERIIKEYKRRREEIPEDRYAIWNRAQMQMIFSRDKKAISLLHLMKVFPSMESKCLEIGFGSLGWLGKLISWGVKESNLFGIEIDEHRARIAKEILPQANLKFGNAENLPFESNFFDLVIVSTVFSSIFDDEMRNNIAKDIVRVLKNGGALLYYDFIFDNPKNKNVKGIKKKDILKLFGNSLEGKIERVTLAPPICRVVARISMLAADILEKFPFLRTHYIAVLIKRG